MAIRVAYSTKLEDLQETYNKLAGTAGEVGLYLTQQEAKASRKVKRINYDDETKEMLIEYDDGSSKAFSDVKITDVCTQQRGEVMQAEVVYDFGNFVDNFGTYVKDFGEATNG